MSSSWWSQPMRIAALQYAGESNPFAVPEIWSNAGFNVEQLLHLIGDGYYACFDKTRHGKDLEKYIEDSKKRGIRIILYVNTHTLPPDIAGDEWFVHNSENRIEYLYDTLGAACHNSPWSDWLMQSLRDSLDYDIDGVFSDGPIVQNCWCKHCKKLFLKEYSYDMPSVPDEKESADLIKFRYDSMLKLIKRFYNTVKTTKPDAICYQNLNMNSGRVCEYLPYNDFVGTEGGFMFYAPPKDGYLWKTSLAARSAEAYAKEKPTVIFCAGDQKSWSRYLHAQSESRIMFASSAANGANVWYGIHCPTSHLNEPGGIASKSTNQLLKKHSNLLANTKVAARVGLLHSDTNFKGYKFKAQKTDFYGEAEGAEGLGSAVDSFEGFAAMLYASQIPFKVITEADINKDGLKECDLLILPSVGFMNEITIKELSDYVFAGGNIVASLDTSLINENGKMRNDFGLNELLGISYDNMTYSFEDFNYYEFLPNAHFADISPIALLPSPSIGVKIHTTTAVCLAKFREPHAGVYVDLAPLTSPAITIHKHGKGNALYLAGNFGEFYLNYRSLEYRQLIIAAVSEWCKPVVQVENAPESLEIVVREQKYSDKLIIHFINYTGGMSRPIQQVLPLNNVILKIQGNIKSAKLVLQNTDIEGIYKNNETIFNINIPNEWEMLVIEK